MVKRKTPRTVATLKHGEASRKNIPSAELRSVMERSEQSPVEVAYQRRNRDLDPQLVWRGKDDQDRSDLVAPAPPLFIQEKVHPKVLVDDLRRQTDDRRRDRDEAAGETQPDLFADFNGLPDDAAKTEFYRHDANWSNRMILGDSLQVMASLAEREGLRGKVQCIYLDPPYGIKFNSNFQWSTTSRDVRDGKAEHISREPEQVKAFRDTWRDGVHSYLTYLRDRLTVARDLLTESGSIFVQIGDENVHRVRALMDEVFGEDNFCCQISFSKTSGQTTQLLATGMDFIIWFAKKRSNIKTRKLFLERKPIDKVDERYVCVEEDIEKIIDLSMSQKSGEVPIPEGRILKLENLTSQTGSESSRFEVHYRGRSFRPGGSRGWSTHEAGMATVAKANYCWIQGNTLWWKSYRDRGRVTPRLAEWHDTRSNAFGEDRIYVVQTNVAAVQHCLLMTTDPGDLVLDPTCGSGTTAYVAEQWGRRWITIDTSRVALALARARIMGARYPYYLLADSPEGQQKEAEVTRSVPSDAPTRGDIRQGFVYERVPHITLKSIANNAEIEVIWERMQPAVEAAIDGLNTALRGHPEPFTVETGGRAGQEIDFTAAPDATVEMPSGELAPVGALLEWEVPREAPEDWPEAAGPALEDFWQARLARQQEIDAAIAAKADYEYLYDKPYDDGRKVRVAGPFTVESLSPHRLLAVDEHDELIARAAEPRDEYGPPPDFAAMILEQLKTAGVQQARKTGRIAFAAVTPWPGAYICAEGRYCQGEGAAGPEQRAGIFVGPEFGTVSRPDLVAAAREAGDAGFDVVIACAFNYEAHASEFDRLGRIPVLKARMNADLHMAGELKNTGKGNLFVIFGEPDIDILPVGGDGAASPQIQVKINGVDVFHPATGEIRSDDADGIACWFIDTGYNEESFFVRHAYFLGANDPYQALRTTLKAEIDPDAWASLHSDLSRPFDRPESGRIAVKVINHLGDEVMKVFRV